MPASMHDLIRSWDGRSVVLHHDAPSGSWFFVALHDDTLGPPTGGCRMRVYSAPEDGLLDALRLARGMTLKFAAAELDYGGGKSVIALSRPVEGAERRGILLRFGAFLESLQGAYWTGEDLGTTPEDMALLAGVSRYVHGVDRRGAAGTPARAEDPGPYTARGALAGLRATAAHLFGTDDLRGRSVLVQGVGDVGGPLVRMLAEAGARILVSDVDLARAGRVAEEVGAGMVEPETVYDTECDLLAPCAVGAVLSEETIPRLRCQGIAGAANNQLADEMTDGERLRARGIVHAPDFLVSAGGAMGLIFRAGGVPDPEILARIDGIQERVAAVLEEAKTRGAAPHRVAEDRVLASLRETRAQRGSVWERRRRAAPAGR
jgi:leucine dehydrogenase